MSLLSVAKSLILAAGSPALFGTKWFQGRIHRKLDKKDSLLLGAFQKLDQRPFDEYPHIFKTNKSVAAAGTTDVTLTGKNLLDDGVKSSCKLFEGEDYEITITAVLPGTQTFDVAIELVAQTKAELDAAEPLAGCTWDGSTLTIKYASDADDWDGVVAAINADPISKYLVDATGGGATVPDDDGNPTDSQPLADGVGEVPTVTIGGSSIVPAGSDGTDTGSIDNATLRAGAADGSGNATGITAFADTSIVFDSEGLTQNDVCHVHVETAGQYQVMCSGMTLVIA